MIRKDIIMSKSKRSLQNPKTGQWVRTQWDDVGARDGILVEPVENGFGKVFFPDSNSNESVDAEQIVLVGSFVTAKDSGL
jgi:hypothetical protein